MKKKLCIILIIILLIFIGGQGYRFYIRWNALAKMDSMILAIGKSNSWCFTFMRLYKSLAMVT